MMKRVRKNKHHGTRSSKLDQYDLHCARKRHMSYPSRSQTFGQTVRRTVLFQFRLAADNIRDLILSPLAIIAALLGLLRPDNPSWALDRLMMFGRATDRYINLFEEFDNVPRDQRDVTIDDLFDHVERKVKTQLDPDTPADEATWATSFSAFRASRQAER